MNTSIEQIAPILSAIFERNLSLDNPSSDFSGRAISLWERMADTLDKIAANTSSKRRSYKKIVTHPQDFAPVEGVLADDLNSKAHENKGASARAEIGKDLSGADLTREDLQALDENENADSLDGVAEAIANAFENIQGKESQKASPPAEEKPDRPQSLISSTVIDNSSIQNTAQSATQNTTQPVIADVAARTGAEQTEHPATASAIQSQRAGRKIEGERQSKKEGNVIAGAVVKGIGKLGDYAKETVGNVKKDKSIEDALGYGECDRFCVFCR